MRFRLPRPLKGLYEGHVRDRQHARSLNLIILGATIGTVLFSLTGGSAFTGLAGAFGANDFVYSLLWALPVLINVVQFYASYLIEKTGKNRKIFIISGVSGRALWLVIAFLPYIFPTALVGSRLWALVVLVTASAVMGTFVNAGFYSMLGDILPMRIRGKYLSIRSSIATVAALLAGLGAAWLLDHIPGPFLGYTIVFGVASIFGIVDILCFLWVKPPPMQPPQELPSLKVAARIVRRDRQTRNYLLFWAVWSFGINLASPFYARYALDVVELNFTTMMLCGQIPCNLMTILMLPVWGRMLDRFGAKPILFITCTVTAVLQLIWLPATFHAVWPLLVFNLVGGMFWCGNDVCSMGMMISHTPQEAKGLVTAMYFIFTAIPSAIAFTLGGALVTWTAPLFAAWNLTVAGIAFDHYKALFVLATLVRMVPVIWILPRVWSEKDAGNASVWQFFWGKVGQIPTKLRRMGRQLRRKRPV